MHTPKRNNFSAQCRIEIYTRENEMSKNCTALSDYMPEQRTTSRIIQKIRVPKLDNVCILRNKKLFEFMNSNRKVLYLDTCQTVSFC